MKASELLSILKENLKNYPITHLKNKAKNDNYPNNIYKKLAIYNSEIYDEIFKKELIKDFEIKDSLIKKIEEDINYYFSINAPGDIKLRDFTRNLCLYLSLIAKKPLHPFGDNPQKDNIYYMNGDYFCKDKIKYINDKNSLCRFCVSKKAIYGFF